MKKLILVVTLLATLSGVGISQTTVALSPLALPQFLNNSGAPCNGCKLSTFSAGTTSNLVTYSESTGTTPNTNPIIMDSSGRPSNGSANVEIFLTSASYKFKMTDVNNVQLWVVDNISWATPLSTFSGITSTGNSIIKPAVAATGGANQSSPTLCFDSFYFNITSLTDAWCLQAALGAGASPTSTFSVTHSGSGGTAAINLPVGLQLNFVQSTLANAASSGFERLATTDQDCWRNAANGADVCNSDAGAAAAGTGNLADLLKWGGGGFQGGAFVDKSAAPAQSGVERTGNNVCAVASRNAAASGDVCAAQVDASNVTNLGSSAGVKVAGPINANSQAIQNGVLTGAANGNSVTLLNFQGPASAIVGNSADQTAYTYTIPANTIAAAKGVRVRSGVKHTTGAASVTYKIFFGATAAFTAGRSDSGTALDVFQVEAFNTTAQTAQALIYTDWFGNTTAPGVIFNTSAENTANAVVVKLTFNVANTDQVTPEFFIVELIQ